MSKIVVVPSKKEWEKNEWKPKDVADLPVVEDDSLPARTYIVREVEDGEDQVS